MGPRFDTTMELGTDGLVELCGPTLFDDPDDPNHSYSHLKVTSVTVVQGDHKVTFPLSVNVDRPETDWMQNVSTTDIKAGDATLIGHAERDAEPKTRDWTQNHVTFVQPSP
jgi:hypothetical protein